MSTLSCRPPPRRRLHRVSHSYFSLISSCISDLFISVEPFSYPLILIIITCLSASHPHPRLVLVTAFGSIGLILSSSFISSLSSFRVLVAVIFIAVSRVVVPNALFLVTLSLSSTLASLLLSSSSCHNSRVSHEVAVAVPMLVACYRCILVVIASSSTFLVIVLVLVLIPI